jgi:hypothetical protein
MATETKAAEPKAEAGKKAYVALTDIQHDLKPYATGKRLMLTDDEAEPLLNTTPPAIKPAGKAAAEEPAPAE